MADLKIQVCYARPDACFLREYVAPLGATVRTVIEASGVIAEFPEIDLSVARVGVFGKLKSVDDLVRDGDRVEIYRPLVADPKESRRQRAIKRDAGVKR